MYTARQSEIIDRSIEIIASKGIQGLTIKNLAKEIGISEPAIYRHFKSKTEIILAILENFKIMAEFLSESMETFKGSAYEKISFMFSKMIEIFAAQPSIVSVVFSEEIFKNEEALLKKIRIIMNLHQNTIENIISKGQQEGNVRKDISKDSLALLVMGALRLLVKRWDLNRYEFNLANEGIALLKSIDLILK